MNIEILADGNLEMSANQMDKDFIRDMKSEFDTEIARESVFISEILNGDPMGNGISYEQVSPEEIGALTSAPIISDGTNVYGYMDYQILNFLDELAKGNTVTWQKG